MATYVVMEPPGSPAATATDGAVFVRDGFHVLAFVVPVFWLLWHWLWIEAALAFAVIAVVAGLSELAGHGGAGAALSALISLGLGFEASSLRIAAMRRRGWTEAGTVEAQDLQEAETRYVFGAEQSIGETAPESAAPVAVRSFAPARTTAGPALGLMAYPDRR